METTNCTICMDDIEEMMAASPGCSHLFHDVCLTSWVNTDVFIDDEYGPMLMESNHQCPLCRREIANPFIYVNIAPNPDSSNDNNAVNVAEGGQQRVIHEAIPANEADVMGAAEQPPVDNFAVMEGDGRIDAHNQHLQNPQQVAHEEQINPNLNMHVAEEENVTDPTPIVLGQWMPAPSDLGCPICGQMLETAQQRHEHILTHDMLGFQCSACGFICHLRNSMRRHYRTHPDHGEMN